MRPASCRFLAIVFASICLCSPLFARKKLPAPVRIALSSKALVTVPLPAMPLGIIAHDGALWVVGAKEMVARSEDGGQTWQVLHLRKNGQLLFAIAFAGRNGWAMGSQGTEYRSVDNGAHWKRMHEAPANVMRLVAKNGRDLMASSPETFLLSTDGGRDWIARAVPVAGQSPRQFDPVEEVAIADDRRSGALLLVPGSMPWAGGLQRFVFTGDGGKTWRMIEFSSSVLVESLSGDPGGFTALASEGTGLGGHEVILRSKDGASWVPGANKPGAHWCGRPQCLLGNGYGWVDWKQGKPTWWKLSAHPKVFDHWAAASGVFCGVGKGLQCVEGERVAAAPKPPSLPKGITRLLKMKPGVKERGRVKAAVCEVCRPPVYPPMDQQNHISGMVLLHAIIGKKGRIRDLMLEAAPSPEMAQAAMDAVRHWQYGPTTLNGHPVAVDTRITVNFTL